MDAISLSNLFRFFVVVGSLCFLQTRAQYRKGSEFRLRLHRPPLFFVIYWVLLGMGRLRNGRWSVPCKQIAPCTLPTLALYYKMWCDLFCTDSEHVSQF